MSKLEELIKEFCPDGVEYRNLESAIISLKTGLNPRKNFILNTQDATNYYVTVREVINGKIVFFDKTDKVDDEGLALINNRSNLEKGDILFSGTGTVGRIAVLEDSPLNWNIKEGVYTIKPNQRIICSKYLGYLLNSSDICNSYKKKIVGSPVCSLPMAELKQIQIPIPPLPVQEEIVRILDNFTELTARKKQYEYYRDSLFAKNAKPWNRLDNVAIMKRGDYITKKSVIPGDVPVILGGQEPAYYCNQSNHDGEAIVISRSGAYAGFVSFWNCPIFVTDGFIIEAMNTLNLRFLYHYLKNIQQDLHDTKRGGGVPQRLLRGFNSIPTLLL